MPSHNQALDRRESYRGPDLHLFFRDLRDRQGRKRPFTVKSWSTIKDVRGVISSILHVPPSALRLYYGPLSALPNHRTLHDAGIYRSGETLLLDIATGEDRSTPKRSFDVAVCSSMTEMTPRHLRHVVQQTRRGFALGFKPELVMDGSGGTYFLHDARKVKVAVFKPADEEPYAENNPRGYVPQSGDPSFSSLREGIAPGKACLREVAAYMLDHGGFSCVPMTTLAEARHPAFNNNGARLNVSQGGASVGSHSLSGVKATKNQRMKVGSFQTYVSAECTMDDLSPSKISKDEVHKIAILDIRLMNADRNAANLLCRRREDNSLQLIPIDHGFCLRSVCDVSWMDWCWLDWPQLKEPLSKQSKDYVLNLDIDADVRMLKETLNIQGPALDYFRASSKLLQEGVKAGLSLYEIAVLCCRNDNLGEIPSKLEVLTEMATELSTSAVENGRWHHATASRAIAEQLSPSPGSSLFHSDNGNRVSKSASSVNFLSFGSMESNDVPGMAPSSASDASSDVGDAVIDQEECEEWAAAIVADVSMEKSLLSSAKLLEDNESASVETPLSSSPKGFWFTKPGDKELDDDSVTWSPYSSPRASSRDLGKDAELTVGGNVKFISFKSPTVTFADSLGDGFLLPPPATVDLLGVKRTELRKPAILRRNSSGLSRSQSYAALRSINTVSSANASNRNLPDQADGNWKSYFVKFVDLVITREITAASLSSGF